MFHACNRIAAGTRRRVTIRHRTGRRCLHSLFVAGIGTVVALQAGSALAQTNPGIPGVTLDFSTYYGSEPSNSLGPTHYEDLIAAALDNDGNLVVAGYTMAPRTVRSPDGRSWTNYDSDVVIMRYGADDNTAEEVVRFGGNGWDQPTAIAVDSNGRIVVAGSTNSATLVRDPGQTFDQSLATTTGNGFIVTFDPSSNQFVYTPVRGSGDDHITDLVLDSRDGIHVSGYTSSRDLPTFNAVQATHGGGWVDGFVAGFRPHGAVLAPTYQSYLGGDGDDMLNAIVVVDEHYDHAAYPGILLAVAGMSASKDRPFEPVARQPWDDDYYGFGQRKGPSDALIAVLSVDPAGARPIAGMNAYLYGSDGAETANDIAVNRNGDLYIVGNVGAVPADHDPLPTSWYMTHNMSVQNGPQGGAQDGFLLRLLRWSHEFSHEPDTWIPWLSTYLGGNKADTLTSVAVYDNWIHVAGITYSEPGYADGPAPGQAAYFDAGDGFVGLPIVNVVQDQSANDNRTGYGFYARIWQRSKDNMSCIDKIKVNVGTYIGGSGYDFVRDIVETAGTVWLVGGTTSPDLPVENAPQDMLGGGSDGFVTRLVDKGIQYPYYSSSPRELRTCFLPSEADPY